MELKDKQNPSKKEKDHGSPGPESMDGLEQEFSITKEDTTTSEPESVVADKKRRPRRWGEGLAILLSLFMMALMCLIPYWIDECGYGFSMEMAAGDMADNAYFDTGDYRLFYHSWSWDHENGDESGYELFEYVVPIKKHFWGYTREDYKAYRVFNGDTRVAYLYVVEGKNGYYNFLRYQPVIDQEGYHYTKLDENWDGDDFFFDEVCVNRFFGEGGELCEVQKGFFFISSELVSTLDIGEFHLDVDTAFVGWN